MATRRAPKLSCLLCKMCFLPNRTPLLVRISRTSVFSHAPSTHQTRPYAIARPPRNSPTSSQIFNLSEIPLSAFESVIYRNGDSFKRLTCSEYYQAAQRFAEAIKRGSSPWAVSISGRDAISADTLHSVACIMRQMQSKTADAFATALWSSASEMGHRPSTLSLARQLIRSGAYTRIPQLRKVEARFEELVSSGKDADALTAAGELLFEQGRFDAAVATTRRALQLSERFEWRPYCELCLGKAYVKTGKGDEARRIFDRLAEDGLVEADVELADLLKRRESGEVAQRLYAAACANLAKRGNVMTSSGAYIVYGIQRVAFRSKIETTNLFMTGLTFFCIFVLLTMIAVACFKGLCELAVKRKWMDGNTFIDFRNGWFTVLKGILFRVALIGFPQLAILCLWEFTQGDSAAEVVLAVFFFFGLTATLAWGASKVIRIARRSIVMHRNPAYILFSDPQALNKWGFLYIQFRASAYYFIVPVLCYTLVKAMFVALAQKSGVAQSIGFVVIEAAALIAASVMRPWMDKSTNSFNIAICVVNFLNAIFLLIFSNVFGAPQLVVGVVGVVLFVLNAAFSLILLLMVIISTTVTFFRKNPDARYQYMADDRASFMKSQTQLTTTTELDALAATARGDKAGNKSHLDLEDDNDSLSSEDLRRRAAAGQVSSAAASQHSLQGQQNGPRSPVNPSMPLFPAGQRPESPFRSASPSPYNRSGSAMGQRSNNSASPAPGHKPQNNASSPWQRGAGYD